MRWRRRSSSMKSFSRSCARSSDGTPGTGAEGYNQPMHGKFVVAVAVVAVGVSLAAQGQKPPDKPAPQKPPEGVLTSQPPREVIRRSVDLVTSDVVVRDDHGLFISTFVKG